MRLGKSVYVSVMAFLFFYLVLVSHAQAYVDPGSASIILQLILAIFLGIGLAYRSTMFKLKSLMKRLFLRKKSLSDHDR